MRIDMSEASEWDGSQAPPNLTLREAPFYPKASRARPAVGVCELGNCVDCGRVLVSAVRVEMRRKVWDSETRREVGIDILHCGRCYTWPKK